MSDTNIPVSDEIWKALNDRKSRGDTFDDVCRRLVAATDGEPRDDSKAGRDDIRERVARVDWDQSDVAHSDARAAAIAEAVGVIEVGGVASRRTVQQVVVRSDRELGLADSSRRRMAADLVPRVDGVETDGDSDLVWVVK